MRIAFIGPMGAGKSAQSRRLAEVLEALGHPERGEYYAV